MELENQDFALAGDLDFKTAKQLICKNMSDAAGLKIEIPAKTKSWFLNSIVYEPFFFLCHF